MYIQRKQLGKWGSTPKGKALLLDKILSFERRPTFGRVVLSRESNRQSQSCLAMRKWQKNMDMYTFALKLPRWVDFNGMSLIFNIQLKLVWPLIRAALITAYVCMVKE